MFGGAWEPQDAGYRVTRLPDGLYQIGAGTLMGVTPAAEVAVYGPEPAMFPELNSAQDQPVGRLRVLSAERAHSTAEAVGGAFDLPAGARGRLVQPGTSERLRVALKPADPGLADELGQSALLEIVPAGTADADVEVIRLADGGWSIGNDVEPVLARVPAGESRVLRAALEWYYRYHLVLQLAKRCSDPSLIGSLSVRLLDCADQTALDAMTPEQLADPQLPEVGRDEQRIYRRGPGDRSCVRISNSSSATLQVTLLNCSAGGLVEYMGDATLRGGGSQVLWSNQVVGRGFPASADRLPPPEQGRPALPFVTDRLIAIGTTRRGVDLSHLTVGKTVQQVVEETLAQASRGMTEPDAEGRSSTPVDLWTATVVPVRITRM
jgi:hypothetical protein